MACLADKIELIIAKIDGGVMPDGGDKDVLVSAAEDIRIFHQSVAEHGGIALQKLKLYRQNWAMSTMDQVIADEAIGELVRLTKKIRMLERRLSSGE